jgi:hypothetical protein
MIRQLFQAQGLLAEFPVLDLLQILFLLESRAFFHHDASAASKLLASNLAS